MNHPYNMFAINSKLPFVSIIVPTLNRSGILVNCIETILRIQYPKELYEVIIIDNGSTDHTKKNVSEIKFKFPNYNIIYKYEPKLGTIYARHSGVKLANGNYLSFIDDDCFVTNKWLLEIVNIYNKNKDIVAVAGRIDIKWDEIPPVWINHYLKFLGKLDYGDQEIIGPNIQIYGGNFHIKKDVLIKLGGFSPGLFGKYCIGDDEMGVCEKLSQNNMIIGWAPKALVYHMQYAKISAQRSEIVRRYRNVGLIRPYRILSSGNIRIDSVFNVAIGAAKELVYYSVRLIASIVTLKKENAFHSWCKLNMFSYQIAYMIKWFTNFKLRKIIKMTNEEALI